MARQHCGHLGKTENCQSGVFIGYAEFADIHSHTLVWMEMPEVTVPERKGKGKRHAKPKASFPPVTVSPGNG